MSILNIQFVGFIFTTGKMIVLKNQTKMNKKVAQPYRMSYGKEII